MPNDLVPAAHAKKSPVMRLTQAGLFLSFTSGLSFHYNVHVLDNSIPQLLGVPFAG